MTVSVNIGGVTHDVTGLAVRVGGALKTVTDGWVRAGGALKQFYGILAVPLSLYSVLGRGNSASVITVTSAAVTATPTGAIGTINYAWTRTAPDGQAWTINAPTSATASFSTDCDQNESFDATFICTVTDQAGQVLASSPVTVSCANIYYGGGYNGPGAIGHVYP